MKLADIIIDTCVGSKYTKLTMAAKTLNPNTIAIKNAIELIKGASIRSRLNTATANGRLKAEATNTEITAHDEIIISYTSGDVSSTKLLTRKSVPINSKMANTYHSPTNPAQDSTNQNR
jgi:DUF4097 and DUF4098 domain-containing protein YvlB